MKPEDIKVGETYYVRVKADRYEVDGAYFQLIDENGHGDKGYRFYSCCYYAFLPTPTPPKYDPCRLFKKGDIVEPVERDGREVPDGAPVGEKCTVVESEKNGIVCIRYDAGSEHYIHEIPYFHLELVTPVEELEPYRVETGGYKRWSVKKGDLFHSQYPFGEHCVFNMNEAKAAAEAERDRLNAEYRKEQS